MHHAMAPNGPQTVTNGSFVNGAFVPIDDRKISPNQQHMSAGTPTSIQTIQNSRSLSTAIPVTSFGIPGSSSLQPSQARYTCCICLHPNTLTQDDIDHSMDQSNMLSHLSNHHRVQSNFQVLMQLSLVNWNSSDTTINATDACVQRLSNVANSPVISPASKQGSPTIKLMHTGTVGNVISSTLCRTGTVSPPFLMGTQSPISMVSTQNCLNSSPLSSADASPAAQSPGMPYVTGTAYVFPNMTMPGNSTPTQKNPSSSPSSATGSFPKSNRSWQPSPDMMNCFLQPPTMCERPNLPIPEESTSDDASTSGKAISSFYSQQDLQNHDQEQEQLMLMPPPPVPVQQQFQHRCNTCGAAFDRPGLLLRHLRRHTEQQTYKCDLCGETFSQKSDLLAHKASDTHREELCHRCSRCGKGFSQASALARHSRTHTSERNHQCHVCGKRFVLREYLHRHLKNCQRDLLLLNGISLPEISSQHDDSASNSPSSVLASSSLSPFACSQCPKTFRFQSDLERHRVVHTAEKPFHCETCGKAFRHKTTLLCHQRAVHSREKPYECQVCGKQFSQNGNLITHQRVHSEEKPHRCPTCRAAFKYRANLHRHLAACEVATNASTGVTGSFVAATSISEEGMDRS